MKTIQEVGTEILSKTPDRLYIMCGDYGIIARYLTILSDTYGEVAEAETVESVLTITRTKQLIPRKPALYIVRYDETFVSKLSDVYVKQYDISKILGTLVLICDSKHISKLDKYYPNNTIDIAPVAPRFLISYLTDEFADIPSSTLQNVVSVCKDYGQCRLICGAIKYLPQENQTLSARNIQAIFGIQSDSKDSHVKVAIASRDVSYINSVVTDYGGNMEDIFYSVMSCMTDIDKLLDKPSADSLITKYRNAWNRKDVYFAFMNAYNLLKISRSANTCNTDILLTILFSSLQFSPVPDILEVITH